MNPVSRFVWRFSANARMQRAAIFRRYFSIDQNTKILDLGSENGANIFNVLTGEAYKAENVYIADISRDAVEEGAGLYGFTPVVVDESKNLTFDDGFFDIVYCSSVIEHTTVPKAELWNWRDGRKFREAAWERQNAFAKEIKRLGKQYFVQTPCKTFPIESHTWLPLVGYFPREALLPVLRLSNRYWVKVADPDFNLLGPREMKELFPDAEIVLESKYGFTKSLMAIRSQSGNRPRV